MIKRLLLLMSVLMAPFLTHAQDTLVYKDKSIELVKVLEVSGYEIKYKMADYLDGPTFVIPQRKLHSILYANGRKQMFVSKNPTLEEKRNPVHARREPQKPNVITINHGYKEIPQFITPYRTKRNLLWGSFTGILDRECVEITGESSEKHNTMMYGGGIGYDRLELLTPKIPIYIKFGLNLTCTTSPKEFIGIIHQDYRSYKTYGSQTFLRISLPVNFGYCFNTHNTGIMPYTGISLHGNAIGNSNIYLYHEGTLRYKETWKGQYRPVTISWNTGVDFFFKNNLYLGINYSLETLPSYSNEVYTTTSPTKIGDITERFHQFEAKFGYNF